MWHHPTLVPFWLKVVSLAMNGPQVGAHGIGGHPRGQLGGIHRVPFRVVHLLGGHRPHPFEASFLRYYSRKVGTAGEEGLEVHQPKEENFPGTHLVPGFYPPKFRGLQAQPGPKSP